MHWFLLILAIIAEVVATSMLKSTQGFTKLWPSVIVIINYGIAFILLAVTLKKMSMSIVYAIWSGVGVMLVTLVAWIFLGQSLTPMAMTGISLIILGVIYIYIFSKSAVH